MPLFKDEVGVEKDPVITKIYCRGDILFTMSFKKVIKETLTGLPFQIGILENEITKIKDKSARKKELSELRLYEKRMKKGLNILNNLKNKKIINLIDLIRKKPTSLLNENKKRYLEALKKYRQKNKIRISTLEIKKTIRELKKRPLIHTTKSPTIIRKIGISPSSELWMTHYKSCANAMDIVIGQDKCVFLTQGFHLKNFSNHYVSVDNKLINDKRTIVSTLDLFTFALIKTKKVAPCSIETKNWIGSLKDYSRNIFSGKDFLRIKAEYILSFFNSIDEYNDFASEHHYSNLISKAPENEYPFLGEIKVFQSIKPKQIIK